MKFHGIKSAHSDVQRSGQLLDSVEQRVAFLHSFVEECDFAIRAIRFDDAADFVNLAVQLADVDEVAQLDVEELV